MKPKMVRVREDILMPLLLNAVNETSEPDFEPNENLGEGEASEAELNYRKELLSLLSIAYPSVTKIVKNKELSIDAKIKKINKLIDDLFPDADALVKDQTKTFFDESVITANSNLKNIKSDIKKIKPDPKTLNIIQLQQLNNFQSIIDNLKNKIASGLYLDEVNFELNPEYESKYDYIGPSFKESQNRLDGMGWYGYFKSDQLGLVATYGLGISILGNLVADWVTMGDENVCEDCQEMADNGPYPVLNWPDELHFGDRCTMGEPYLLE